MDSVDQRSDGMACTVLSDLHLHFPQKLNVSLTAGEELRQESFKGLDGLYFNCVCVKIFFFILLLQEQIHREKNEKALFMKINEEEIKHGPLVRYMLMQVCL